MRPTLSRITRAQPAHVRAQSGQRREPVRSCSRSARVGCVLAGVGRRVIRGGREAQGHADPLGPLGVPGLQAVPARLVVLLAAEGVRRVLLRRRSRPGRRAGTRSPCRGPASPRRGSWRRAGAWAPARPSPACTSAAAAMIAVATALDLGASAMWIAAWARFSRASGRPTNSTAWAAATAACSAVGSAMSDVLAGVHDQPPGDEPRVLTGLDHPGQVVQGRVRVTAAQALDERADHVVVLVAGPVVPDHRAVHGPLQDFDRDLAARRQPERGRLQVRQRPAGVAAGQPDQVRAWRHRPASRRHRDPRSSVSARSMTVSMSASVSGWSVSMSDRDSSGLTTEKTGSPWSRR